MLVKELIKKSIWIPSCNYEQYKPTLSILLPAYGKAKSGLFEKVLDSILKQTFKEFELIIIDDASIDGTKKIIDKYMKKDQRISCIHHPENIGLPAISEYEAFMKSSGKYIMFAFDDFIFELNAFEELLNSITKNKYDCCYGQARLVYLEDGIEKFFENGLCQNFGDAANNWVSNSAVILSRTVLETVGLYDPHILMARECDWDLWARISKCFLFPKVDVYVGIEYGVTQNNSLGNSYNDNRIYSSLYKLSDRDKQLLPEHFADKNIIESQSIWGHKFQAYLDDLLDFYKSKFWCKKIRPTQKEGIKKIAFYSNEALNYSLCFENIHNVSKNFRIKHVQAGLGSYDLYCLIHYDAVIVDRNLVQYENIIIALKNLSIPCYYFIDDNFLILKNEYPIFSWYSKENMTRVLSNVDAVLVSTKKLKNFFIHENVHPHVVVLGPILNQKLIPAINQVNSKTTNKKDTLNIAVVGGNFRSEAFFDFVVPALNKLVQDKEKISLSLRNEMMENYSGECLFPIKEFKINTNYNQFIHLLRRKNINVIIHPMGKTKNAFYKTNSVLLSALYLNANIIVFDEPAFSNLSEKEGIIKVSQDINAVVNAIKYLSKPANANRLKSNLKSYCYQVFNEDKNIKVLNKLMKEHKKIDAVDYVKRNQILIRLLEKPIYQLANNTEINEHPIVIHSANEYKSVQHCFDSLLRGVKNNSVTSHFKTMISTLNYKKNSAKLELKPGISLHKKLFIQYRLKNTNEKISKIMIACPGYLKIEKGLIGIELVIENKIVLHQTTFLSELDFSEPITFSFPEIAIPLHTELFLRVFARDVEESISVYEVRSKKWLPYPKNNKQLFCLFL